MIYMNILRRLIFYANFLQANYSNFLIVWVYHTAKWVSSEKYMFCEPSTIHWNICFNFKTALVWAKKVEKKCKEFDLFIFYFDIRWLWPDYNHCKIGTLFYNSKPTVLFWFQVISNSSHQMSTITNPQLFCDVLYWCADMYTAVQKI